MCPKGTFSFERGAKDYLDCQGCPPGRICETEGITNITQTAPCTDGRVCVSGTGALQPTDCPEGYFCPEQTTGETMFDNPCVEGFFCRLGTGGSTKTRDNCPQTYFCPPGTGTYDYVNNFTSYDNWKNDAPTRCPRGTGQDGADTKTSLLQCGINTNYKLTIAAIDIRSNYKPVVLKKVVADIVDSNTTNSTVSRRLQTIEVASKDDAMLKDLWEISNEIARSYDNRNEPNKIRSYLNVDRQYIMRINPLNLSLCDRWFYSETLDNDTNRNNEPSVIFKIHPNSYALITMDLRHLMEQEESWVYGEDWDISLTIQTNLSLHDQAQPVLMPETFLHKNTTKSQVLEFQVLAWDMIYMRIDVLIYNTLYMNHKLAFINSTSVEIRAPNRAIYGTEEIFIATLQDDFMIMLPFNQPPLQSDKIQMPQHLVTFAQYKEGNFTQLRHASTKNRNIWIPSSLYWNQRPLINIAYLPYFSNCNGYGSYIPLWSVYEQNNKCQQYELDEINYMNEFSFGQNPTADNCDKTIINCVFDEIPSDQQPLSRWFEVDSGTPIFNIAVDPTDYEDFMTRQFTDFDVLNVAPANGNRGDGWIPTNFDFVISYFQKGPKVKKIIIVDMDYTDASIIKLSDDEYNGVVPVFYNLTFSFLPLSHKDLLVMFAFQSYLYIVLYIVIGILSVANMVILSAFHRVVARPYQGRIARFRFFSFLKLTTPPAFGGVMLALAPICVGQLMIIIIMTGKFLTYDCRIFQCDSPVANDCKYTIFDLIKDDPDNISVDYQKLRTGRCGVAMLASGVYQLFVGLTILIPDTSDKRKVQESYNGNIWNFYEWKRSNMIFCSLWVILFSVMVIQFSFSGIFQDNIWTMVVAIKAIAIGIDWFLEKALQDNLLVMPLSITQGTVLGLVTFGSSDFLAFIDCYFIEFGIMLFERCYLGSIVTIFFDYIENKLPTVIKSFLTWINNDNQDEGEVDQAKNLFGKQQKNADSETSDSRVLLSDENSLLDDMMAGSDEERDQNLIFRVHADWNESASNSELSAKFKKPVKRNFSLGMTTTNASAMGMSYDSESISLSSGALEGSQSGSASAAEVTLEDSLVEQEVEPLIEAYADSASESVTLLFNPYFVLVLWVFYDETVVAKMFGIKSYDFVYYFLFALTIVPFQIVVDIIQYNTTEWFHHLPIHDYLDYLKFRFSERKSRWKGNEGKVNMLVAKGLQPLDQLCFSSQFYFVQTIYVSGMCQCILGIQTLLFANGYNMFGDFGAIPVMGFTMIKCFLIHRVTLMMGNWIGVWKIDAAISGKQAVASSGKDDLFILLEMITAFQKEEIRADQGEEAPDHLKFKLKAWNQIDRIKIKDSQLKADLRTDRMMAENFKELFLQYNKPWLRENLQEVLTPRTIFAKRAQIIEQLGQILGPIDPDVTVSVAKKSDNSDSQKSLNESEILRKKHKARLGRLAKKFGLGGEKISALIAENKITPISQVIIKYWVTRMRVIRKLRVYVQGIVDLHLEAQCQYCGYTYGLLVELIQSIEDMFYTFLKKNNLKITNFPFPLWIKHFKEHARFRTLCQECLEKIERFGKMRTKKQRLAEVIGVGYEDDMEIIKMKTREKEANLKKIGKLSARSKDLIHRWILVSRKYLELYKEGVGFLAVDVQEYTDEKFGTPTPSHTIQHVDKDDIEISRLLDQWQF